MTLLSFNEIVRDKWFFKYKRCATENNLERGLVRRTGLTPFK